jgi:predicted O-methyltransferase YrrM
MLQNFIGDSYRLANNWYSTIPVEEYKNKSIKYLEIGTFYGANLISVANSYCSHKDSKLYCIDPWKDYDEYPEYKGKQESIYKTFIDNIEKSGNSTKININRGYSNQEILKFDDNFFDIIYIDGNHEPEYVLEDAVLSFRKLKAGGIIIFDDYGWGGPELTKKGIDGFLDGYHKRIKYLGEVSTQVFIRKLGLT